MDGIGSAFAQGGVPQGLAGIEDRVLDGCGGSVGRMGRAGREVVPFHAVETGRSRASNPMLDIREADAEAEGDTAGRGTPTDFADNLAALGNGELFIATASPTEARKHTGLVRRRSPRIPT